MKKNIAVIGAGISGMATAFLLRQKNYAVTIYAKAFSPDTTSNKAAAFWFPYQIRNDKRGIGWSNTSYNFYSRFAQEAETGISMKQLLKVEHPGIAEEQSLWIDFMPAGSYRLLPKEALGNKFDKVYDATVPLIETQVFLPWLQNQLLENEVAFIQREVIDFDELKDQYDLLINCTGLGAKKLCNDENLIPVRGQVALLSPQNGLPIYLDNEKLLYVVPRKDAIIVGGTYEENIAEEITEKAVIDRILANVHEALPSLKQQKLIGSWAGLRPYRKEVRLVRDTDKKIIHNYGHGGSGFTLAFGCAQSVVDLVVQS